MRVAYLVNQYPKISHSFIRREIAALERQGVEVERFSVRRTTEPLADERDVAESQRTQVLLDGGRWGLVRSLVGVAVTRPIGMLRALNMARRLGLRSRRGLAFHAVYLAEACVLLGALRRSKAEHLHAHFATNPATVATLCRALGGPAYSFTFHGPEFFEFPDHDPLGLKVAGAAFVVAISHHGRSQLLRVTPREHWERVHLVHCGVDREFLDRGAQPVPHEPRFVCVARLDAAKGIHILIEAAAELAAEGRAFTVAIVGDGPMRSSIEASIREHRLEKHVELRGWKSQHEVVEEIEASRALVLPSFEEGLPVVFMEALALERPVISTFIAGIPELVRPGRTGWLVPASDAGGLADAMRDVLDTTPERLGAMGAFGARLVRQHHDAEVEGERLARHFEDAVAASGRRPTRRTGSTSGANVGAAGTAPNPGVRPVHSESR